MQNFSLKVCLRQSKRSQFYDHIVCPFSPIHFVILLSPLTATPCVVFTKLCCLFLRPFAFLASQLQSGRIFTIPVTFQQLKPDDIKKKTKFISPTTAIVSNITVFLFTYCYTKTISRTPCSSSKRDIQLLKSRGRLTEDFLSTHHLSCLFNRMIKILIFFHAVNVERIKCR